MHRPYEYIAEKFELSEFEYNKFLEWYEKFPKWHGAIGGAFRFSIQPTSIGTIITAEYCNGEKLIIREL